MEIAQDSHWTWKEINRNYLIWTSERKNGKKLRDSGNWGKESKWLDICVIKVPREEQESGVEKEIWQMVAEIFPSLAKDKFRDLRHSGNPKQKKRNPGPDKS